MLVPMDAEASGDSQCCCACFRKSRCLKDGQCAQRCHQAQDSCVNCWVKFLHFLNHVRMLFVRSIFFVYSIMSIWTVVEFRGKIFWLLLLSMVPLIAECVISLRLVKKKVLLTSKWFSPVVFLFLLSACPSIWLMEIHIYEERINHAFPIRNNVSPTLPLSLQLQRSSTEEARTINLMTTTQISSTFMQNILPNLAESSQASDDLVEETVSPIELDNSVTWSDDSNYTDVATDGVLNNGSLTTEKLTIVLTAPSEVTTRAPHSPESLELTTTVPPHSILSRTHVKEHIEENNEDANKPLSYIFGSLTHEERARVMEQMLLLTLIVGRWLLPKGEITRDELSQLLLVNIGMAADIIELFEAYREDAVKFNQLLTTITLCLWQGSLLQFTLTKTATRGKKQRGGFSVSVTDSDKTRGRKCSLTNCLCCETELWAIFTSLFLQDLPFFVFRMTLIFKYDVLSYSNVFFTCKNTLVILLQFYRISVIVVEHHTKSDKHAAVHDTSVRKKRKGKKMSRDASIGVDLTSFTDSESQAAEKYVVITLKEKNRRDFSDGNLDLASVEDVPEGASANNHEYSSLPRCVVRQTGVVYKRRRKYPPQRLPSQKSLQHYSSTQIDEEFNNLLPKQRSKSVDVVNIESNAPALANSSSIVLALPEILDETEES